MKTRRTHARTHADDIRVNEDTVELAPLAPKPYRSPASPRNLADSGLSEEFVGGVLLKSIYSAGTQLGQGLSQMLCLPFNVIEPVLQSLKEQKLVEVEGGQTIGAVSYRFALTQAGHHRAKELVARCAYVGPAPVPLVRYTQRVRDQAVTGMSCTRERLDAAFQDLVVSRELIDQLGTAIVSGKSLFLYGPPGNGKTAIARALGAYLDASGRDIYVPYAVLAEDGIVTVFDPTIHHVVPEPDSEAHPVSQLLTERLPDARWCRVRRPVVVTGGELTLEMLDLRHDPTANFYQAPLHVKANGGVFLVDDFGRQLVSPRDLLNRWILPLEEREDYLTLHSGRKFSVPFDQLVIFSTNLNPSELVDEAFLRRMRHKIRIDSPSRQQFERVFERMCTRMGLAYEPWAVEHLYQHHFGQAGRAARNSDPRDLLELLEAVCRYNQQAFKLTPETFAAASRRFFHEVPSSDRPERGEDL